MTLNPNIRKSVLGMGAAALLAGMHAQAAPVVGIDTLHLDATELVLSIDEFQHVFKTTEPAAIIMGQYQNPIVMLEDADGDTVKVYSAPPNPAPSGTAHPDVGTLDVDFTSLKADFTLFSKEGGGNPGGGNPGGGNPGEGNPEQGPISFTAYLWDDTTQVLENVYDPLDDSFSLGWVTKLILKPGDRGADFLPECEFEERCKIATSLKGQVKVVPVPAAVWLLGSGLLGLAGVARRRRAG